MPTDNSRIRDNNSYGKVADFLKDKLSDESRLSIVSAYFTIYAYDELSDELEKIDSMRFLFGEPKFINSLDPSKTDKKFFSIGEDAIELVNCLQQKHIAQRCAKWIAEKADIRSIKESNLLHGKLYHLQDKDNSDAIFGSSNFTCKGLGLSSVPNIELNLIVEDSNDRADLKLWFDKLWNDTELVEDVKKEVLHYLEKIYENHSPEFIYFKTLYHIFEEFLSEQSDDADLVDQIKIVDTQIWKSLFEFQKDGVKAAIHKINSHNGCILADSVGLGKTYVALAVIKYFELQNYRVLVLCPRKMRDNWTVYLAQANSEMNPFPKDKFEYTVLSHTDLSRDSGKVGDIDLSTFNWSNYNLIVIDESHNFRNNVKGRRDEHGDLIKKSRYEKLLQDIIVSGVNSKIMLLSATPVNNRLQDLRNQINFITKDEDSAFSESCGINSLKDTIATAQRAFTEWSKQPYKDKRDKTELMESLPPQFFTLLDELTIARSRKHITKYYPDSLKKIGGFPTRKTLEAIRPNIDVENEFPSYDDIHDEILNYQLSLFSPTKYVFEKFKGEYESKVPNFSQENREHYLIAMMKVNFLKRLESSVHSFKITMKRTIEKIDLLKERLENFSDKMIELDEADDLSDEFDEGMDEDAYVGGKLNIYINHLDTEKWINDLEVDKKHLKVLADKAELVTPERDEKLRKLKERIKSKVEKPTMNLEGEENRKVLIFCAFADTARYLYDCLKEWAREDLGVHIALVSGGTSPNNTTLGGSDFSTILTNFSPRSKGRDKRPMSQEEEIDILIATDCISEGQNLQDCDLLINYDIHWNPVRIIQRFGRINRIGSLNSEIQLVNFWPTDHLDKYIDLKNRVEARMALVDISATADDNILQDEQLIAGEIKYRDQQVLRLKDEILELEDFDESITLTDFTLEDFRRELLTYIEANKEILDQAPLGLYALVPADDSQNIIQPGVIFCLRQKEEAKENKDINPLQPYFLIYVREDGEVRYNFTAPKQVLDMLRKLCRGNTKANAELCSLFDKDTDDGRNMQMYDGLLNKAVSSVVREFHRKRNKGLFTGGRDSKLTISSDQVQSASDFELITWIVLKDESSV